MGWPTSIVEKMVEARFRRFVYAERKPVYFIASRGEQIKSSQITKGRRKLRKTIRETIKKGFRDQ